MKRRTFLVSLPCAFVWPPDGRAQQTGKVYRVGLLFASTPVARMAGADPVEPTVRGIVHGLRDLGYIEGKNLILERRSAENRYERSAEIAAELVQLKTDVIVTAGASELIQGAMRATSTVPIVMANSFEPVESGFVASLARPGGNVTGLTNRVDPEIEAKRLQILKETLPAATRIAFLGLKSTWEGSEGTSIRAAATALGVRLTHVEYTPSDFSPAFDQISRERPQALYVARHPSAFFNRRLITEFALRRRIPGIYPFRESVEVGGLMSYGASIPDQYRRAAIYVDKILKGEKPADLPVQQPTKFELVINLKTAEALGLAISPLVLATADEVIE
jgi:putative tryptophan/tyrosine transport system substrate-binding protein